MSSLVESMEQNNLWLFMTRIVVFFMCREEKVRRCEVEGVVGFILIYVTPDYVLMGPGAARGFAYIFKTEPTTKNRTS